MGVRPHASKNPLEDRRRWRDVVAAIRDGLQPPRSTVHHHSPKVDGTDFYLFNSYEAGRTGYVTMIASYQPFENPQGGPNYYTMDPNALYEI